MSTVDPHVTHSKKRWTTEEQATFLTSKIPDFLKAQSEGRLSLFWPTLDKEWLARFPERELPATSPDEPSAPLSTVAVLDYQWFLVTRKNVSSFLI
jgi:hypothetical protein